MMCVRFRERVFFTVQSQIPEIAFSFDVIFSPFLFADG